MAADWKTKYMDIRAKLKDATDVAYRLGYEKGMKDGTQAAQMQQMAAQQQQQAAMMGGGDPAAGGGDPSMQDPSMGGGQMPAEGGDPSQDPSMGGDAAGSQEMEGGDGGSELDSHINELQSLVAKGEKPSVLDIRKAVTALAEIRKAKRNIWAQKVEKIIPAQKKVVDGILKKWEKEAEQPSAGLEAIIKEHGLKIE